MKPPVSLRTAVLLAAVVAATGAIYLWRASLDQPEVGAPLSQAGIISEEVMKGAGGRGGLDPLFEVSRSKEFVLLPKHSKVVDRSVNVESGVKESIIKFEVPLSPKELSWFYVEALVADGWGILRDDLTETIGWNAIFIKFDDKERTLAIFAVVKEMLVMPTRGQPSDVRIVMIEQL
jgi:hypothetical protein